MTNFSEDLASLETMVNLGDLEAAYEFGESLHDKYHRVANPHFAVHMQLSKIARLNGNYVGMIGNFLAGFITAYPASWLHKRMKSDWPTKH